MPTNETRPAIGTAEAAVQSCVRLIASVSGQPEALVAYWLDLSYCARKGMRPIRKPWMTTEDGAAAEPEYAGFRPSR